MCKFKELPKPEPKKLRTLVLKRIGKKNGNLSGVLKDAGEPFAVTLENEEYAIPTGIYKCKISYYNKGKYKTFEITNVSDKTLVKFHSGNLKEHSLACVLIGEMFDSLIKNSIKRFAILHSRKGFKEFMQRYGNEKEFYLKVEDRID